jgi:hypothetical protein
MISRQATVSDNRMAYSSRSVKKEDKVYNNAEQEGEENNTMSS